jgi:hypothetical protein
MVHALGAPVPIVTAIVWSRPDTEGDVPHVLSVGGVPEYWKPSRLCAETAEGIRMARVMREKIIRLMNAIPAMLAPL